MVAAKQVETTRKMTENGETLSEKWSGNIGRERDVRVEEVCKAMELTNDRLKWMKFARLIA